MAANLLVTPALSGTGAEINPFQDCVFPKTLLNPDYGTANLQFAFELLFVGHCDGSGQICKGM